MEKNTIDLTEDSDATASPEMSEDEDLRRAIAMSLETAPKSPDGAYESACEVAKKPQNVSTTNGILGIDRKKQEKERLARLKRKRDTTVSPPPLVRLEKRGRVANDRVQSPAKETIPPSGLQVKSASLSQKEQLAPTSMTSTLRYPDGVVKQTWAFGYPRTPKDIKIEEVLERSSLEAAVLSSFQWDFDWLFPKLDTKRTPLILVMQAKYESQKQQCRSDFNGIPSVRLCFPPMDGQVNCMHSKLMLLFYEKSMRIVVPTANLVPYDWGESGGIMENTVFVIDLPRSGTAIGERPDFAKDLNYFLKAKGLPNDVIRRVDEHDFAKTRNLGFVHGIGGVHTGDSWKRTGLCGLARSLQCLGLISKDPIKVDFVTSSVGSLNEEFLRSIYLAAQGDDGLSEYTSRTAKSFPTKCVDDPLRVVHKDVGAAWIDSFCFYYPSDDTIRASKGGPGCAGTICFQEKWWNNKKFPRQNMHDCFSRRPGLLMHNKVSLNLVPMQGGAK